MPGINDFIAEIKSFNLFREKEDILLNFNNKIQVR